MRICVVAPSLGKVFEAMGHEVAAFWPEGRFRFDLARALDKRGFEPDLVFQQESLGPRTLLTGLETLSCPKIFWSLDTHLNLYWHRHYARLFDGVLTPHVSIWQQAAPSLGLNPQAGRMAMYGSPRPWRPFAERSKRIAFVARITEHRPTRRWLAEFLAQGYDAFTAGDLPFQEMMDVYADAWLAPNESILREVNFRVMEAASCGCLVLSQDVGPDQDVLLAPGREMETYGHVLDLKGLLDHYLEHPEQAEALARAAWKRIRAEHLPRHRAQAVLDFAARLSPGAAAGAEARAALTLAMVQMRRGRMANVPLEPLLRDLEDLGPAPEALAARAALLAEAGLADRAVGLLAGIVARGEHEGSLDLDLAGSMAGLKLDQWDLARQFWYRRRMAQDPGRTPERPLSPAHLCLLWATELQRAGDPVWDGMRFDPEADLPGTVLACLQLAWQLDPDDRDILRRMESATARQGGWEYLRLGHLSTLTLFERKDWRLGLTLAVTNLRAFRLDQGLEELALARDNARAQGKEAAFGRMLSGLDPSGAIARRLARGR